MYLCISYISQAVNENWNEKLKPYNSLYIPVFEDDKKYGQDMYLYSGCPMNDNNNNKIIYLFYLYSGCPMIARMNDNNNKKIYLFYIQVVQSLRE